MASCPLLFLLVLPLLVPFPLSGARTRILSSRLPASMMAFSPLPTSPSCFLPLLPAIARAQFLRTRVRLNWILLHPFLTRHTRPLGRIPFPFLPSPLPSFLHLFLILHLSLRLFLFPSPPLPSLPALFASLHSLLPHLRQVAQCCVPCPLTDIACRYVSLCRFLIFLAPPSLLFFLLRLGSQPEIQEFSLS